MEKTVIGKPTIFLKDKELIHPPDKSIIQPGELGATIELVVREGIFDPNGKITNHIGPKPSESFLRAFMEHLFIMFSNILDGDPIQMRDTSNNLIDIGKTATFLNTDGAAGAVTSGIIVGTGNTAPTINDYVIETLIAHGVGAGQLQYSIVTYGAPAADATTSQFTITRNFANGSGGAITVNEVGLYVETAPGGTPVPYYFMTIRDVIAGGISVPNGQTLTVNYRPQAVV
jgi:hypothetical protein